MYRMCIHPNSDLRLPRLICKKSNSHYCRVGDQHKARFLDINVKFIFDYFDLNVFMFYSWHLPSEVTQSAQDMILPSLRR